MRLGIVIDSAAEVPASVLANPHVRLLPVKIRIDDQRYVDERQPDATRDFNSRMLHLKTAEVSRSVPPDEPEIRKFMIEQLATGFDHVFGLFVTSTRSPIFKNAFEAASRAITDSMPVRMRAGIKGPARRSARRIASRLAPVVLHEPHAPSPTARRPRALTAPRPSSSPPSSA